MSRDVARSRVLRFTQGVDEPEEVTDRLAGEEPLGIRLAGEPFSVTMRTPGHDVELVAGNLLAEGVIDGAEAPLVRQEQPNVVNVAQAAGSAAAAAAVLNRRRSPVAASCGLCGKASIEAIHQSFPPVAPGELLIPRARIGGLMPAMEAEQTAFASTGGIHAAGLFDCDGRLLVCREDIGRHNAVDKVIGYALLKRWLPLERHILVVSGRVSFEIVQKALGARIPVLAAVSAPSSLAVEFAEANGQTLIGFLREGRYNVYSHPERIGL
jgi:FdhD protein